MHDLVCAIATGLVTLYTTQAQELRALSSVESAFGSNMNHALILTGIHAGTAAGGRYGIMPKTARPVMCPQHPACHSDLAIAQALTQDSVLDHHVAKVLWSKLRQTRPALRSAAAWYYGPAWDPEKTDEQVCASPYVRNYAEALLKEVAR